MAKLEDIEGIGKRYANKLRKGGVRSQNALLETGCTKSGRKNIATECGVTEKQVLNWVNRADLGRIKGVSTQYADLLECVGVDSVPEMAQRNAENLRTKMEKVNNRKSLVRQLPSVSQVTDWVKQCKKMKKVVKH